MKRQHDDTPSFDFDSPISDGMSGTDECKPTGRGSSPQVGESTWHEVPQSRFLSWGDALQRAYCAARDRDAADDPENADMRAFYVERAASYDV